MTSMQNYLLGMIEQRILDASMTPIQHTAWPNIGNGMSIVVHAHDLETR